MPSLNKLLWLQRSLNRSRIAFYNRFWGMTIDPTVVMSLSAKMDRTYPKGVHVGAHTYIAFRTSILCHDRTRGIYRDTIIGKNCFIGAHSLIMPGVRVGDNSIVAAGAVVLRDVPPRSIVAGNPAKIVRSDIEVGHYGRFLSADQPPATHPGSSPDTFTSPSEGASL
jgi:acetyltransferase-like isoleucine patch superfamily enzyme